MISYARDHPDFPYFQQYDFSDLTDIVVCRGQCIGILEEEGCLLFRVNIRHSQKFEFDFFILDFHSFFELAKAVTVHSVITT